MYIVQDFVTLSNTIVISRRITFIVSYSQSSSLFRAFLNLLRDYFDVCSRGGGVLHIIWVRGRAIGKGIVFHDFGIRNGIDFHDFGIRNGIDFRNFCNW